MITKQFKTLGLNFNFGVPESAEEYDSLAKRVGACLDSAVANHMYRGVFAEVRAGFVEALETSTGIKRKTKETGKTRTIKGSDGAADTTEAILVWDETEADYFARVCAETSTTPESYQSALDKVVAGVVFDPSAAERAAPGPKTVAKKFTVAAQTILDAGAGTKAAAKLSEILGITVEPTLESLAKAIAEDQKRKEAAMANSYV